MTKIKFDSFKSILCLNGDIPPKSFFNKHPNLIIIAADGAGASLIKMGIYPKMIIGDFDSFAGDLNHPNIEYIKHADQNSTDYEKSILEMEKRSLFPALVCGGLGKEVDHAINNMRCLMKYGNKHPMVFYNNRSSKKAQYCIPIYDQFNFKTKIGDKVSLLPYPEATLSTEGLKWNLDNTHLSMAGKSSARNQASAAEVSIKIHQGQIMLVI
ncbi:MAG: thiamine diphosphokinase [Rickettsiaceae bacterium]|nr:thiamine diphosphokinase [Rickettsiaceae bacterium]